ncbi:hypothetical protein IM40_02950 [Candidatus Paracaedimonas acanthamoebae]|nr:hypothetical protein IM40_02950 [Candidatus Paracaedimonas acanthamoebae]
MQKIFPFLLMIAFCFNPLTKASHQEILDETKIEKSSRNWTREIKRLGYGLVALGTSYAASSLTENDDIPDAINVLSTYYLTSSLMTLGRYCLEWYGESVAKAQHISTGRGHKKGKMALQQSEKVERAAQENIRLTRAFLRQTQSLINAALKVGAIYTIFQHNLSDEPLNTAFVASMYVAGLIYNLNELRHTYTTGQARSDIPVLGILDGMCEVTAANKLFHYWRGPGLEIMPGFFLPIYHQSLTSTQWAIYRFLQMHGDAQAINGVFQIFSNIISGSQAYLKRNSQIIERLLQQPATPQSHQAGAPQGHQPLLAHLPQPAQLLQVPQPHHAAAPQIQQPPAAVVAPLPVAHMVPQPAPQQPLATRRPRHQTPHHAAAPLHPQLPAPAPQPTPKDLERQEALTRIQAYRQATTIKESEINKEIQGLIKILTNDSLKRKASLKNLKHGKRAIVIDFGNGKSFRIVFEPPHAQNNAASDEYKGYGKTRVLDALQVGHLYGWDEDKILKFMDDNNITRFYNIPLFLLHILWDRGEYNAQ